MNQLCLTLSLVLFASSAVVYAKNPPLPVIPTNIFSITQFGAVGDGTTMNTVAIQKTVDAAAKAGGGVVFVPEGHFLTGPFTLASRINLHLDKNAAILISDDRSKHPVANDRYQDCISVSDAQDIA